MKVAEAKQLVVDLIVRDLGRSAFLVAFDPVSPDGDQGKFLLNGMPARAIHHFDGWYVPINLRWFEGGFDPPAINRGVFHWYVFALPRRGALSRDHYFVCDFLQMREWVLDFAAPLGRDHRDHNSWRADLRVLPIDPDERSGHFRWGDEPVTVSHDPVRMIELDNVATLGEAHLASERVGVFGRGGESSAHRLLKLYVAAHGGAFGLSAGGTATVEHRFRTGDRVDVMFHNHRPERTVIEVEISGEENICTGVHQAIKYRSLAEVEGGFSRSTGSVRSVVVAYDTDYQAAELLAERYEVDLVSVEAHRILGAAV